MSYNGALLPSHLLELDNPNWTEVERVHNWRNYATKNLQLIWPTLSLTQKLVIAECLQEIADREHWD